jgi:AhpD family alkylhydroperoxidase
MKARLDFRKASPQGENAMKALHMFVRNCGLDRSLLELVKLRASQMNGCAHCIDMHTKELRADGESEQRLYLNWEGEWPNPKPNTCFMSQRFIRKVFPR